jgi:hypothetical protein
LKVIVKRGALKEKEKARLCEAAFVVTLISMQVSVVPKSAQMQEKQPSPTPT